MRRIVYLKEHSEKIRKVRNPFPEPESVLEYALRDHINKVKMDLIDLIERHIRSSRNGVDGVDINEFLKEVPVNIFEIFHANKMNQIDPEYQDKIEAKVKAWMLDLGDELEIGPETVNYYWEKASSNFLLGI